MKVDGWMGQWAATGRLAMVILLPATVTLLSACWEWDVAGPLIGVGAVDTGVTIAAAAKGAPSSRPSVSVESQSGDNSNPVVAHSAKPQSVDHGSSLVAKALPAFTPSTILPPTIAAATDARSSRPRHLRQVRTRHVTRSANARPPDRRAGPVMMASKSSTAPATLSPKTAAAKGPPSAHLSHRRGSITRVLASSAKPQPSDHLNAPVAAALLFTGAPRELPATTIVH